MIVTSVTGCPNVQLRIKGKKSLVCAFLLELSKEQLKKNIYKVILSFSELILSFYTIIYLSNIVFICRIAGSRRVNPYFPFLSSGSPWHIEVKNC